MIKVFHQDERQNKLQVSDFQKFEGQTVFNQVAAKFVLRGEETYIVEGQVYALKKGEYILGNAGRLSETLIKEPTTGLCLDISQQLIAEVLDERVGKQPILDFLHGQDFLVNKYKAAHTSLGLKMSQLAQQIQQHSSLEINRILNDELFFSLAESIIADQVQVVKSLSKLAFKKTVVNQDNFRRLHLVREYIDDSFLEDLELEALSRLALISKYSLIRLFKSAFGLSPYQYILKKRLDYARQALLQGQSIAEVAQLSHFADVAAFSKAFKQAFGLTPGQLLGAR